MLWQLFYIIFLNVLVLLQCYDNCFIISWLQSDVLLKKFYVVLVIFSNILVQDLNPWLKISISPSLKELSYYLLTVNLC